MSKSKEREKEKEKEKEKEQIREDIDEVKEIDLKDNYDNLQNEPIQYIYYFILKGGSFIKKTCIIIFKISGIYLLWICLHYFASHLYIKFCVPNTIMGFIMSPFMVATPHCQGLRWIVYNGANFINHMWLLIGAWIYTLINANVNCD